MTKLPFGLWPSPLSPRSLAGDLRLNDVQWDSDGRTIVWLEGRSGQGVLMALDTQRSDAARELNSDLSVRARVGYGGGDFCVAQGSVFFAEAASGRIFRQELRGGGARPITPAFGHAAAPALSPDGRWLLYVHSDGAKDVLAIVDAQGQQWPQRLVVGHDFYMQPTWHPNGRQIAYVAWNHPQMPWDGSTLYLADLDLSQPVPQLAEQRVIAGDISTAVFQPSFSPDGRYLAFISDASGWGQVWVWEDSGFRIQDSEGSEKSEVRSQKSEGLEKSEVRSQKSEGLEDSGFRIQDSEDSLRGEGGADLQETEDRRGEAGDGRGKTGDTERGRHGERAAGVSRPNGSGAGRNQYGTLRQLSDVAAEHGEPAWAQGMRTMGWSHDSRAIYVVRNERGSAGVFRHPIDGAAPSCLSIAGDYNWFEQPALSPLDSTLAVIASGATQATRLLLVRGETTQVVRRSSTESVEPQKLGQVQPISWEAPGGVVVHGILTMPPGYVPGSGALPPAIIRVHGGPTGQSVMSYSAATQFFATRGYVVLDVNYRGSAGYGREYMLALRGNWGVYDVEDCVSASRFLAEQGLADGTRIAIMGGSAGGYTVLEALCRAPGVFRCGLCLYGVSNMFTLAADTHKFEAHYLDSLLGPLPEAAAIYRERSPIFHAELLRDPVAIFQGADDKVVPQAQSDTIVAALKANAVPHEYHIYAGEGHGWRKAETIEAFYKAVDAFLRQYLLFA